jgi:hypothetical protein
MIFRNLGVALSYRQTEAELGYYGLSDPQRTIARAKILRRKNKKEEEK